jgi:hypothetical protein
MKEHNETAHNVPIDIVRGNCPIEQIRGFVPLDELLAQLAEEASELAQAALKMRRTLTDCNPTPITRKQAEIHPDRNILLQCVGAGGDVVPEYGVGEYNKGDVFLVCSDGFRHRLAEEEMMRLFGAGTDTEKKLIAAAKRAVEVNMQRKERDNITVVAVRM